jgi:hypothetical protein
MSLSSIFAIALGVSALFGVYARRAGLDPGRREMFIETFVIALFGWLLIAGALGWAGVFQTSPDRTFPTLGVTLLLVVGAGMWLLARSASLSAVVHAIPLSWLVGVQVYRVVGFIFLSLYGLDQLPGEFALPAGIGDVAIGLAAPVVAFALYRRYSWAPAAARVWNVAGIADLVVAVATGFLSSPGPLQMLALDRPNQLISAFPLVLIPLFAVPLSVLLHLAALKRLPDIGADRIPGRSAVKAAGRTSSVHTARVGSSGRRSGQSVRADRPPAEAAPTSFASTSLTD